MPGSRRSAAAVARQLRRDHRRVEPETETVGDGHRRAAARRRPRTRTAGRSRGCRAGKRQPACPTAHSSVDTSMRRPSRHRPARSGRPRRRSRRPAHLRPRRPGHRRRRVPSLRARRHGWSLDVIHAPSWVAGVLTPPAACASSIDAGQRLLADARRATRASRRRQRVLGDAERTPQRGDLVGRLDPPGRPHRRLRVDEFGVGERHRQQLGECRCQRVGSDPPGGGRTVDAASARRSASSGSTPARRGGRARSRRGCPRPMCCSGGSRRSRGSPRRSGRTAGCPRPTAAARR